MTDNTKFTLTVDRDDYERILLALGIAAGWAVRDHMGSEVVRSYLEVGLRLREQIAPCPKS